MFRNNSRTFYNYLKNRNVQTLSAYCHFHSFFDLPENNTLHTETMFKTALESLDIIMYSFQHKIWSQVQTITHAVLLWKQSPGVSNFQRGRSCEYIFYSLTTFLNPWSERTHYIENGESSFFSQHKLPCVRLTLVASVRLLRYSYTTLNRFWKKKNSWFEV